jgi:RNA polymerase sigma-70 factor, ECF subfamily
MKKTIDIKIPRQQFDRMIVEQCDKLHRVARRLVGDSMRAEDLVQETYARAIGAHDRFVLRDCGIGPWLLRIMHNLNLNQAHTEKRQPKSMPQEAIEMSAPPGKTDLPIDRNHFQSMDERLVKALHHLPESNRSVMLLWAVHQLSYKEIAESLALPLGTVMSRLYRARERMRSQLQN